MHLHNKQVTLFFYRNDDRKEMSISFNTNFESYRMLTDDVGSSQMRRDVMHEKDPRWMAEFSLILLDHLRDRLRSYFEDSHLKMMQILEDGAEILYDLLKDVQDGKVRIPQRDQGEFSQQVVSLFESYFQSPGPQVENKFESIRTFTVRFPGRIHFVSVDDVIWIEAADNYAILHTARETHLVRETMNHLESKLDPRRFCRTHRSAIVNLDSIRELRTKKTGDWNVVLQDGITVKVSRSRRAQIQTAMGLVSTAGRHCPPCSPPRHRALRSAGNKTSHL